MRKSIDDTSIFSRRALLAGGLLAVSASALSVKDAAAKAPQWLAGYRAEPKGKARCGNCSKFEAPNGCTVVNGPVSVDGWCRLYASKPG